MDFSRRQFVLGTGSLIASLALGSETADLGPRRLRLGVISDLHIAGGFKAFSRESLAKNLEMPRTALKWLDAQGVDAVVIPGDIADLARIEELQGFADVWNEVFPNGKGADGRPVEKLFIYGNHESYPQEAEKRGSKAIWTEGRDKVWERAFGEPFADLRVKTVKGYDFLLASWGWNVEKTSLGGGYKRLNELVRQCAKSGRTFFVVQHFHPKDTCHGPLAWGHDEGVTGRALAACPQAVVFSGHSHYVFADEKTVWQREFTSIGAGSLKYSGEPVEDYPPFGCENTVTPSPYDIPYAAGVRAAIDAEKIMPRMNRRDDCLGAGNQGLLVDVYDTALVLRRHEFRWSLDIGDDWTVPLPARAGGPFDPKVREKESPRCEFAAGVKLEDLGEGMANDRRGAAHAVRTLRVPGGARTTGAQLMAYDVGFLDETRRWNHLQFVTAGDFNLPPGKKMETFDIPVRCDRVPPRATLAVRPCDSFARPGGEITL